ncbi:hypothetical protein K7X08_025192 [Anisodus acutangulus]|uniref:Uncharacterized protein n=1 Tax=Anisodus acutangulus TaxID=402998 RepID=A0A9Q1RGG4_9SOLA|nr:hypothetical protein K7X08_025192 [Anisodus acutangulus]
MQYKNGSSSRKENGECVSSDNVEVAPESVAVEGQDASEIKKLESPALSASAESSPSNSIPKSSPSEESVLPLKDSKDSAKEVDSTSPAVADSTFTPTVVSVSIIPEQKGLLLNHGSKLPIEKAFHGVFCLMSPCRSLNC